MSLPTSGRVLITTSAGDIDIELWAKETPKTCRNFIALAMEGYYDGVIFHRCVNRPMFGVWYFAHVLTEFCFKYSAEFLSPDWR